MESIQPLLAVALVAASVACAVAVWALIEVARASSSARLLSDDTRERLIPLLDKVDVTVDAVNAELLRVDAIITQVEGASARVSHASDALSGIVNTPAEIVNDVATRVRRAWKDRRRSAEEAAEEQRWQAEDEQGGESSVGQSSDEGLFGSADAESATESPPTSEPNASDRPPADEFASPPPVVNE